MKVFVKTPGSFTLKFNNDELERLSDSEINEKITKAVNEILENQIGWTVIKEYIAFK